MNLPNSHLNAPLQQSTIDIWQLIIYLTDIDNSGYVSDYELQDLFKEASLPLPGYKVREIVEKILAVADNNKDGKISFEEFVSVSNLILSWLLNILLWEKF